MDVGLSDGTTLPMDVVALRLFRYCEAHPLNKRFQNWVRNTKTNVVTEPWQVLGFKYHILSKLFRGDYELLSDDHDPKEVQFQLADIIHSEITQPYLWKQDTWFLAEEGTLPDHVISKEVLPAKSLFMVYDTPLGNDRVEGFLSSWMHVWDNDGGGIGVTFDMVRYLDDDVCLQTLGSGFIPYGKKYPDDFSGKEREEAASVLNLLAFINSPYVDKEPRVPSGRERKDLDRSEPYKEAPRTVHFITLRREVREAVEAHRRETSGVRGAYKRWWWVSGHNRKQWYPSEQAHHVIWIAPYRKGDVEAAEMVEKIYHVKR